MIEPQSNLEMTEAVQAENLTPNKRMRLATSQTEDALLKKQHQQLKEKLRKLQMLSRAKGEESHLEGVIEKWREAARSAFEELKNHMSTNQRIQSRHLLASLGFAYEPGEEPFELSEEEERSEDESSTKSENDNEDEDSTEEGKCEDEESTEGVEEF